MSLLALGAAAGASAQATETVTQETIDVSGFAFFCPTEVVDLSGTATETIRLTQSGVRFSRTDVFKMDGATGLGRTSGTVYRVTGENVITLTGSGLQVTFHTTRDPLGNFHAGAFETHLDCF